MNVSSKQPASGLMVIIAFTILYVVWGSTYFFIRISVMHIPPMAVGCLRFLLAGILMLLWCILRKEKVFAWSAMRPAMVSGLLLLFLGNGALIWSEQYLSSSLAAILLSAGPIWFLLLDKRKWAENFRSRETMVGVLVGFAGVILLFGERLVGAGGAGAAETGAETSRVLSGASSNSGGHWQLVAMVVLLFGSVSWAGGSLYSKYRTAGNSNAVNAGWQMLTAGVAYIPAGWISGEWSRFQWSEIPMSSLLSILYLVTMGSLAGYSAFTWLLQVRSATQVSTHAYVNPVVAVLLGVLFMDEHMSFLQILGLIIILVSVLLINFAKYRASSLAGRSQKQMEIPEAYQASVQPGKTVEQ
jgi:drug/metabolite transporter (DMT)-like permease